MSEPTAPAEAGRTNTVVAQNATKPGVLPLDQMALIGIMGKPADMTALFRTDRGDIHSVKEGHQTGMGQVFEITQAGVVVTRANGNAVFIPPIPVG